MKWNFKLQELGYDKQGIRDIDIEIFDKNRYGSIVREAIQNSLDAIEDKSKPVIVKFKFGSINKKSNPALFEICDRLKASLKSTNNEDDLELINRMIEESENQKLEYLEVSDYNTIGMLSKSTYNSFASSRNVSQKNRKDSGGSKGVGKAAYFAASPLRTILVSSKSENEFLYQGIGRLASHAFNGKNFYYKGFFSFGFDPILNDEIPEDFKRKEKGTSIKIIGLWSKDKSTREEKMIKALLDSFWLAIYDDKLIVEIGKRKINKNTLDKWMKHVWDNIEESSHYKVNGNPRPYFETLKQKNKNAKLFKHQTSVLGSMKLYLAKNKSYPGRIAFFRNTKMLIYKAPLLYRNFCGVFICDDENGNEVLKRMENATHNEWNSKNWKNKNAKIAKLEIQNFIDECKSSFIGLQDDTEVALPGLDKLISLTGKSKISKGNEDGHEKINIKIEGRPEIEEKPKVHKHISEVSIYAQKINDEIWYRSTIEAKKPISKIEFEIIAGSDRELITDENRIDIVHFLDHEKLLKTHKNKVLLSLEKGKNVFDFILDDNEKHALYLKRNIKDEV